MQCKPLNAPSKRSSPALHSYQIPVAMEKTKVSVAEKKVRCRLLQFSLNSVPSYRFPRPSRNRQRVAC
jgi:hypothetical protein